MNQATPDPVIDEIREIRHAISARYEHDPTKLVAFLMQFQQQFQDRLIYDPSGEFIAEPTDAREAAIASGLVAESLAPPA
jgi:hypothetical protein